MADRDRTQALFHKLLRSCRTSFTPKPDPVHQLRTNIRRVETVIAATWSKPPGKELKLMRRLSRIRKRAGKVRDFDVQIAALESLRLESVSRDKARVLRFLEKSRVKRENKLLKGLRNEIDDGLQKRLKRTASRLRQASASIAKEQGSKRLSATLEQFAAAMDPQSAFSEANLHEFRMACKRIRYFAEMAGESHEAASVIRQLKRIQDAIGDWHDWLTLTSTAAAVVSPQSPLLAALRANTRSRYLEAVRTSGDARRVLLEMHRSGWAKPVTAARPQAVSANKASA